MNSMYSKRATVVSRNGNVIEIDSEVLLAISKKKITEREQERLYLKEQEDRDLFMYDIRRFHPLTSIL